MMKRLLPFTAFFLLLLGLPMLSSVVYADAIGAGFYDDRYILISYSGCSNATDSNNYAGTYKACPTTLDSVSFEFYGNEFAVWANRQSAGGDKTVCVDGNCSTISNYSATLVYGEWFRVSSLDIGFHTVTITNSTGTSFRFDALYVAPADAIGTPPPQYHIIEVSLLVPVEVTVEAPIVNVEVTVEVTVESGSGAEVTPEPDTEFWDIETDTETQTVSFEYTATAGDVFIGMGIYGLIASLLVLLVVQLWKK